MYCLYRFCFVLSGIDGLDGVMYRKLRSTPDAKRKEHEETPENEVPRSLSHIFSQFFESIIGKTKHCTFYK